MLWDGIPSFCCVSAFRLIECLLCQFYSVDLWRMVPLLLEMWVFFFDLMDWISQFGFLCCCWFWFLRCKTVGHYSTWIAIFLKKILLFFLFLYDDEGGIKPPGSVCIVGTDLLLKNIAKVIRTADHVIHGQELALHWQIKKGIRLSSPWNIDSRLFYYVGFFFFWGGGGAGGGSI